MKRFPIIILVVLVMGCKESELLREVQDLKYGTSFGECIGYCLTDLSLNSHQAEIVLYGWNNSVVPKKRIAPFSQLQLENILSQIDPAVYESLDPVLGCPDCADGGAEWLELTHNGRTKKITFEYGSSVAGIDGAIQELRALTTQLKPN